MKAIWKYPFEIADEIVLAMPGGAGVLSVQMQGNTPTLWALVDTDAQRELRSFVVWGIGHEHNTAPGSYVGTIQEGQFAWHIFEKR